MEACKPICSYKEVLVGKEYLLIMLARDHLIPEIVRVTRKPRKVGDSKRFHYITPGKKTAGKPKEEHRYLSDTNIDGGGYNRHHLFLATPENCEFLMKLVLAQDTNEYRRLY